MVRKRLPKSVKKFVAREEGAVTVDWVVLTASVVSLGMVAGLIVWNNSGSVARNVQTFLASQSVDTDF